MKIWNWGLLAVAVLSVGALFAQQDLSGTWQGTMTTPDKKELRIVVKVSKDGAGYKAAFYSIDQTPQPIAATLSATASSVSFTVPAAAAKYDGKLDSDGVNLTGNWTQGGGAALPLNLKHLGPKDPAWPMPDAPPAPKAMAADADPEFDAMSIKPSAPGAQGRGLTVRGRQILTINTPASFIISFIYGVHSHQIVGAPGWADTENYDMVGTPAQEGTPNQTQLKTMFKKLLADRFQLKFHMEKRELSVYAIQVGKNGPKMTVSQSDPKGLPGLGFSGLGKLNAANSTMKDLASLFQTAVLDRPVVDQTGLDGHYDFALSWTPDESQFAGMGLKVPPPSDKPDAPPDLTTAMLDQLGLKLAAVKAPVDVIVIDKIEKPSAN
jgi:uncharacterized protein (TIGR03435 family)